MDIKQPHSFGMRSGLGDYTESNISPDAEILGKANCIKTDLKDNSLILDGATIRESVVSHRSVICGNSYIKGSTIINSVISGRTYIWNSFIKDSIICENARIHNSTIANSRIWGNADIQSVSMPQCYVSGNSCIRTTELPFGAIIESGLWTRPPLTFICNSGFTVCESKGDNVIVSCTNNSIDKWLSGAGRKYGKLLGLKEHEIDEIQGYVELIRDAKNKAKRLV